ncbi:MAG: hypothetical protein CMI53_01205 [Parcubacteria group bacterium]|nr:hypothetical protein [Parcubacteria group bacterium]
MKETHARSIFKTISWRVIATLTTTILVYLFTGSFKIALGIGFFEASLKLLFYYLHERAWDKINWGTALTKK